MENKIIDILKEEFPGDLIKYRRAPGGKELAYIEGSQYIRRLNEAFKNDWNFSILEYKIFESGVMVLGKLSIPSFGIEKEAFGGADIMKKKSGEVINIADDLKSAATDALKKAASMLGVGLHLYSEDPGPVFEDEPKKERLSRSDIELKIRSAFVEMRYTGKQASEFVKTEFGVDDKKDLTDKQLLELLDIVQSKAVGLARNKGGSK